VTFEYAIIGYGRMGRAIEEQADKRGHSRTAIIDPASDEDTAQPGIARDALKGTDVAFEFTAADAAEANVIALLAAGAHVVCGTTGWKPSAALEAAALESAAGAVIAPNFSVGMNLFYRLVREAGLLYGAVGLHEPFVFESHHRGKLDAPSGTARKLASILVESVPDLETVQEGNPEGRLPDGALHVSSLRVGHEPGSHTVGFDGEFDKITLGHAARSRAGFALGAVLAAEWIVGKKGLHGFEEVLQEKIDEAKGRS
jgi:4-hydroxy-tetrahydrodipicolinate reductase